MDRQEYFDSAYETAKSRGHMPSTAFEIATRASESYVEPSLPIVEGSRSLASTSPALYEVNENTFDILVGYPDSMLEEGLEDSLDSSGWENFDKLTVRADMEHNILNIAQGEQSNIDEKWNTFLVDSMLYKKGNEIRAQFEVPKHEQSEEFKSMLKDGKLGASIEYRGQKNGNKITNWEITGYSFTEEPHYSKTKQR